MNTLENMTALVTGASGSIGSEIARTLARQGANVLLHYHSRHTEAEKNLQHIRQNGGVAAAHSADVTSEEEVERLVHACIQQFGGLDILVLNAGVMADGLITQMSLTQWRNVIETNLTGSFLCCKHALRFMMRKKRGRIIGISSIAGSMGNAGQANYAASKAGIQGLIFSIAQEYGKRGIRANLVAPGLIQSEVMDNLSPGAREEILRHNILGKAGTAEDVASAVSFLASPAAEYINGTTLRVDGGWLI